MTQTLIGSAVLVGVLGLAPVLRQQAPPERCVAAEHRQFDFWQGEWDVFDRDDRRVGRNRIDLVLGGCALVEHWEGAAGGRGTSLNAWSADDRRWRQMWVDGAGGQLDLRGTWDEDTSTMTLSGAGRARDGHAVTHEIAWLRLEDGSVRQRWRQSRDAGQTWTTVFDGQYRRRPGG